MSRGETCERSGASWRRGGSGGLGGHGHGPWKAGESGQNRNFEGDSPNATPHSFSARSRRRRADPDRLVHCRVGAAGGRAATGQRARSASSSRTARARRPTSSPASSATSSPSAPASRRHREQGRRERQPRHRRDRQGGARRLDHRRQHRRPARRQRPAVQEDAVRRRQGPRAGQHRRDAAERAGRAGDARRRQHRRAGRADEEEPGQVQLRVDGRGQHLAPGDGIAGVARAARASSTCRTPARARR